MRTLIESEYHTVSAAAASYNIMLGLSLLTTSVLTLMFLYGLETTESTCLAYEQTPYQVRTPVYDFYGNYLGDRVEEFVEERCIYYS